MKTFLLVLLAVSTFASTSFAQLKDGDAFADLTLKNEKNEDVKLSSIIQGKVAVLDFWSTKCGNCIAEIPKELEIVKSFEKNPKVIFVMIAIDRKRDEWIAGIDRFFHKQGNHYNSPDYWDSEAAKKYDLQFIPRFVVINDKGKIVNIQAPNPSQGLQTTVSNAL